MRNLSSVCFISDEKIDSMMLALRNNKIRGKIHDYNPK